MIRRRTRTHRFPIAVLVLFVLLVLCLRGCLFVVFEAGGRRDGGTDAYVEDGGLVADGFVIQDGRARYEYKGIVRNRTGIDVSDHQDDIDWGAVAADGISFAMLRVGWRGTTEGGLYVDERFYENLSRAHAAGIACGAYFFSQATSVEEAQQEAAFVLEIIRDCTLEYPVAFDYEVEPGTRAAGVPSDTIAQAANVFCDAMSAAGFVPMLYGNTYDLARYGTEACQGRAIWCAEYDADPSYDGTVSIWQYTNEGVVAGVGNHVDLNLDLKDAAGI